MKRTDRARISTLLSALNDLDHVDAAAKRPKMMGYPAAMELSITGVSNGLAQGSDAYTLIDTATGRKVLRAARTIILDELKRLGVEP